MNYKVKKAFKDSKKYLIVFLILYVILEILLIAPIAVAIMQNTDIDGKVAISGTIESFMKEAGSLTSVTRIAKYNADNVNRDAVIYDLNDIESLYYDKPIVNKKKMSFEIRTINKGTILNIDPEAYKMTVPLDAKYVLVPVIVDVASNVKSASLFFFL